MFMYIYIVLAKFSVAVFLFVVITIILYYKVSILYSSDLCHTVGVLLLVL